MGCGSASSGGGSAKPVATTAVTLKGIQFAPRTISVKVGARITWTNEDDTVHDVAATKGADFKSKTFGKGGTFAFTPDHAGTISYVCTLHPGMEGTITVTG